MFQHTHAPNTGNVETEPELLLEIMELNEDIELAKDKPSLESVEERIEEDIREIIENVKQAFDDKNGAEAPLDQLKMRI